MFIHGLLNQLLVLLNYLFLKQLLIHHLFIFIHLLVAHLVLLLQLLKLEIVLSTMSWGLYVNLTIVVLNHHGLIIHLTLVNNLLMLLSFSLWKTKLHHLLLVFLFILLLNSLYLLPSWAIPAPLGFVGSLINQLYKIRLFTLLQMLVLLHYRYFGRLLLYSRYQLFSNLFASLHRILRRKARTAVEYVLSTSRIVFFRVDFINYHNLVVILFGLVWLQLGRWAAWTFVFGTIEASCKYA